MFPSKVNQPSVYLSLLILIFTQSIQMINERRLIIKFIPIKCINVENCQKFEKRVICWYVQKAKFEYYDKSYY